VARPIIPAASSNPSLGEVNLSIIFIVVSGFYWVIFGQKKSMRFFVYGTDMCSIPPLTRNNNTANGVCAWFGHRDLKAAGVMFNFTPPKENPADCV
jgi:hypothetical protein